MKFEIPFIIKQVIQSFRFKVTDEDRVRVQPKIDTFVMSDELNNGLSLIWDYDVNQAIYATKKSFLRSGMDAQKDKIGYSFMFSLCNIKDYPFLIQMNARSLKFFSELSADTRDDWVLFAQMRMRNDLGKYESIQVKQRIFNYDSNGNIWMMLVMFEPSLHEVAEVPYMKNLKSGEVVPLFGGKAKSTSKGVLSVREKEVVELLRQGRTTNEIAQELSIDYETVRFHTKNIRKKTKTSSIKEALHVLYTAEEV